MSHHPCRKFRIFIPFFVLAFAALLAWAVRGLWNGVLTDVLGVKAVTYWQALGILVLSKILFGGFPRKGRGRFRGPWRRRMMQEEWQSLTPEQREKMRRGCCSGPDCAGDELPPDVAAPTPKS
jgi:hypothetical protein